MNYSRKSDIQKSNDINNLKDRIDSIYHIITGINSPALSKLSKSNVSNIINSKKLIDQFYNKDFHQVIRKDFVKLANYVDNIINDIYKLEKKYKIKHHKIPEFYKGIIKKYIRQANECSNILIKYTHISYKHPSTIYISKKSYLLIVKYMKVYHIITQYTLHGIDDKEYKGPYKKGKLYRLKEYLEKELNTKLCIINSDYNESPDGIYYGIYDESTFSSKQAKKIMNDIVKDIYFIGKLNHAKQMK